MHRAADIEHPNPVWGGRANALLWARGWHTDGPPKRVTELLPVRLHANGTAEVCCVPFAVDGIALGDIVTAADQVSTPLRLSPLITSSGRVNMRVVILDKPVAFVRDSLMSQAQELGALVEFGPTDNLLSFDCASADLGGPFFDALKQQERDGHVRLAVLRPRDGESRFAAHLNPAWRDKANFLIHARLDTSGEKKWEQVWARRLSANRFILCCVPAFAYDLALGDEIEAAPDRHALLTHVIAGAIVPSGHWTFRVWFARAPESDVRGGLLRRMKELACTTEWYSARLLCVDTPGDHVEQIQHYLQSEEAAGRLTYEIAKSS